MKLYRYDFLVLYNLISLLPSINLVFNIDIYAEKNFAIEFSWLCFHARLLFLKKEGEQND